MPLNKETKLNQAKHQLCTDTGCSLEDLKMQSRRSDASGCTFAVFVGFYFQDLFKTARSILVLFLFSYFCWRFQVVQPYSCTDTVTP